MPQMVSAQHVRLLRWAGGFRVTPHHYHVLAFLSCLNANDVDRYHASIFGDDTSGGEWGLIEKTPAFS
jgi:hypothetical protein